jgi:ElaB/YqjD/DUF883 family membrane-anchored ribosome-binding protein
VTNLTDERLREIAAGKPIPLAVCAATGDPSWADVRQNAAELLAARTELRRLRAIEAAAMDIAQVTEERDDPWASVPITARQWDALKAALAAKGTS